MSLFHLWGFRNKDQRRIENDRYKQAEKSSKKIRTDEIATHTHLDLYGRKGFIGLARSMPAFIRHRKNLIYAKWIKRDKGQ